MDGLNPTRTTVLEAIMADPRSPQWYAFFHFCRSLVSSKARGLGLRGDDVEEAASQVLVGLPTMLRHYDRRKARFRTYLSTIAFRLLLRFRKQRQRDQQRERMLSDRDAEGLVGDPCGPDCRLAEEEERQRQWACCWTHLSKCFEERTLLAFRLYAIEGKSAAEVADELGMTTASVYKAKSNVTERARDFLE